MKKTLLASCLVVISVLVCVSAVPAGARSLPGGGASDVWKRYYDRSYDNGTTFTRCATSHGGDVVVVGASINNKPSPDTDFCVLKYAPDGTRLWNYFWDGGGSDAGIDVTVDAAGNVFACGLSDAPGGNDQLVVLGLNPDGKRLPGWPRTYSRAGMTDGGMGITLDQQSNIVVAGYSQDAGGNSYLALFKYNRSGQRPTGWPKLYSRPGATNGGAVGTGIDIDPGGDYVVSGQTRTATNRDCALWRISPGGTVRSGWPKMYGSSDPAVIEYWGAVKVDMKGNYMVNGASFTGGVANGDIIFCWYSPDGNLVNPPGIMRMRGKAMVAEIGYESSVDADNCAIIPAAEMKSSGPTGYVYKFHDDGSAVPGWPRALNSTNHLCLPLGTVLSRDGSLYVSGISAKDKTGAFQSGFLFKQENTKVWFLAEGSTGADDRGAFETWVLVQNTGTEKAIANLLYQTPDGPVTGPTLELDPGTRQTVNVAETVDEQWSVSTIVTSDNPVNCERAVYWNAAGAYRQAATDSIGVNQTSRTWFLAEGSTGGDARGTFETWVLVQNPSPKMANVELVYQTPVGEVAGPKLELAAGTRQTVDVGLTVPGEWSVSTTVTSDVPIVAERSMYWNTAGVYRQAATDSIGTAAPFSNWYMAEGSTGREARGSFETWVLLQNPGDEVASAEVFYQTPEGEVAGLTVSLEPGTRQTVEVSQTVPDEFDVSTRVESDNPIICERAVYWDAAAMYRQAATDSIGSPVTCDTWYLPEGSTGGDSSGAFETWVLVQNPGTKEAKVQITYQTPDGEQAGPELTLEPGTRQTVDVSRTVPTQWSVSTKVESDEPVIAERSMYWNAAGIFRQAATDSIGIDP